MDLIDGMCTALNQLLKQFLTINLFNNSINFFSPTFHIILNFRRFHLLYETSFFLRIFFSIIVTFWHLVKYIHHHSYFSINSLSQLILLVIAFLFVTRAFFSYVLFCNYCFEPTIFHMPNSIKLRNWSTWLLLFLFFNSCFCVEMRSGVAFLSLLETSGECSSYSLASIKPLVLGRCGQELFTAGIAGSDPHCYGSVSPRQLPARHPAPVGHSLLSLLESVLQKYLLCLILTCWQHPRSLLWVWGAKHSPGVLAVLGGQRTQCWSYSIRVTQK